MPRREMRARFEATRLAQADARRAVLDEPYDPEAVQAAFDHLRATRMTMESAVEAVVLDIVADLDAETRMAAIEAGRERPHRRGPRRERRGPPRGGPPPDERN